MPMEYAWDIHNGYVKKDIKTGLSTIKQRGGIEKLNTVSFTNECTYIFEPKWAGGSVDVFIREGTRWAKYDNVDTFDDLDTGRTDGVRGMAVMFDNEVIMVDGGTPRKCTAAYAVSDLSADASMPDDATAVHVHGNKVWLNSTANPMKAYYSKTDSANAADSWSASDDAGNLDFSKILPSGDKLIGFKSFAEHFILFIFEKYVAVYTAGADPSNFAIQQVVELKCVSGHGQLEVGNDLAVASKEGLNSFKSSLANQALDLDDLTKHVAPLYRTLLDGVSDQKDITLGYSHSLNHLYICLPGTDHTILVYSPEVKNVVGRWTGYKCYSIVEKSDATMLIGGDGYVYTMNSGTSDDGTAISFSYDFPALYFKAADNMHSIRQLEGVADHEGSPLLTVDYSYIKTNLSDVKTPLTKQFTSVGVEWDSDDAVWDEADWAGATSERFLVSSLLGRGKGFLLSLSNSVLDSTLEIQYIILRFRREGIRIR